MLYLDGRRHFLDTEMSFLDVNHEPPSKLWTLKRCSTPFQYCENIPGAVSAVHAVSHEKFTLELPRQKSTFYEKISRFFFYSFSSFSIGQRFPK